MASGGLESIEAGGLQDQGGVIAVVLHPHILLHLAGGAVIAAGFQLDGPVPGEAVLQAQSASEAQVQAVVLFGVEGHLPGEVIGFPGEGVEFGALLMLLVLENQSVAFLKKMCVI